MNISINRRTQIVIIAFVSFFLISCAYQPTLTGPGTEDFPGFFWGMFHGFFAIFSFIASFFADIRIYSFPNSGIGYDAGFLIGFILFVSSVFVSADT